MGNLRDNFAATMALLADRQPPVLYRWGGSEDPAIGLDCSGSVIWGCRQVGYEFPVRPTADWLWDNLERVQERDVVPGDLCFYGQLPVGDAHHVVVCLPQGRIASMSHGSRACTTEGYARAHKAWMRVYDSPHYRADLLGYARIPFPAVS
jgi:cell wall-associated NlpC family hydrolase